MTPRERLNGLYINLMGGKAPLTDEEVAFGLALSRGEQTDKLANDVHRRLALYFLGYSDGVNDVITGQFKLDAPPEKDTPQI
jgi:hypothetical protein